MTNSLLGLRRRAMLIASATVTALSLCACSGTVPQGPSGVADSAPRVTHNGFLSSSYKWYTIAVGPTLTQVTGIADNQEVVGTELGNDGLYHSFTSNYESALGPYAIQTNNDYPDDQGTWLTSITVPKGTSGKTVEAGYVYKPDASHGYWGVIDNKGLWTLVARVHNAGNDCFMMQLYGLDSSYDAVGFYWQETPYGSEKSACVPSTSLSRMPEFTQNVVRVSEGEHDQSYGQPLYTPSVPYAWPVATGISNGDKLLVGYTSLLQNTQPYVGWSEPFSGGTATPHQCCGTGNGPYSTQILGVNDEISSSSETWAVGTYNTGSTWNGFILENLTGSAQWITKNFPGASSTTISGIDKYEDICGWYVSGSHTYGFVGIKE